MTEYRRAYIPGASWFFTANLAERKGNRLLIERIDELRVAFHTVRTRHPFRMEAVVILPDHLHCVWTLPSGDTDYSTRWGLIKSCFSRMIDQGERISQSRLKRGERGLWQRRFWEHLLRDQSAFNRHVDYIHWNPVKHGYVRKVADWPHSSLHAFADRGVYPANWGNDGAPDHDLQVVEYANDEVRCVLGAPSRANPWPWLSSPHPTVLLAVERHVQTDPFGCFGYRLHHPRFSMVTGSTGCARSKP